MLTYFVILALLIFIILDFKLELAIFIIIIEAMEMKTKPNRISDLIKTEKKANYKNIPQDERSDKLGSSETKE